MSTEPGGSAKRDPRNPEKVGKYVIVKEVGRGSTGVVYLSNDPYYRRDVAIKVYNIESQDEDVRVSPLELFFDLVSCSRSPSSRRPGRLAGELLRLEHLPPAPGLIAERLLGALVDRLGLRVYGSRG